MTPQEQNVAIAESLGWTDCRMVKSKNPFIVGCCPKSKLLTVVPQLDAWLFFESSLSDSQENDYDYFLRQILTRDYIDSKINHIRLWKATLSQRREAYLCTIGKWLDGGARLVKEDV